MLAVRLISCFLCGVAAGALVRALCKKKSFFDFRGFAEPENRDTDPNPLRRYGKNLWRNVRATAGFFFLGVLLSAAFQRYVPAETMTALFGGNEALGVLMAATVGVPLYACGGGTIPLLQQWLLDGMRPAAPRRSCSRDLQPRSPTSARSKSYWGGSTSCFTSRL